MSVRILWAVKILLVLRKASVAGTPLMKGRELQAACIGPGADSYLYRRTLRKLVAKTDYVTCVFRREKPSTVGIPIPIRRSTIWPSGWRADLHEASNIFWSYENILTMQPLRKVCMDFDRLMQSYLSEIQIEELESLALSRQSRFQLSHPEIPGGGITGTGPL